MGKPLSANLFSWITTLQFWAVTLCLILNRWYL
jgi:hypothetical protein